MDLGRHLYQPRRCRCRDWIDKKSSVNGCTNGEDTMKSFFILNITDTNLMFFLYKIIKLSYYLLII